MNNLSNKDRIRAQLKSGEIKSPLGVIQDLKPFAEGGNGLVYFGKIWKHKVAVKFLAESGARKTDRFKAEYVAIALLPEHSNVVKPIAYGELKIDSVIIPYIVMPRFDGHLTRPAGNQISDDELMKFLVEITTTLSFLHDNGVIHRDLKPQNIFLRGKQRVIGDFGIASYDEMPYQRDHRTKNGEILGNREFAAPEQLHPAEAKVTMDIFAIGQLCQWMATGVVHRGTNRTRIEKPSPSAFDIDHIVEKCLSQLPKDRYQSCDEILTEIAKFKPDDLKRQNADPWESIRLFSDAISQTFPRGRGLTISSDPQDTEEFLANLAKRDFGYELWWTMGPSADHLSKLEKLEEGIWLLNKAEVKLEKIAAFSSSSSYKNFVLLQFAALPPMKTSDGVLVGDEGGLVDGIHYITMEEHNNGYAIVEGKTISLAEHKVETRIRFLRTTTMLITVRCNCAFQSESEGRVAGLISLLDKYGGLPSSSIKKFEHDIGRNIDPQINGRL